MAFWEHTKIWGLTYNLSPILPLSHLQVSAGLWTQCVSTLNEMQQKAIQDLLNTAWAWNMLTQPFFKKAHDKLDYWISISSLPSALICTVYGCWPHPTPTILLFISDYTRPNAAHSGSSFFHFWWKGIGHPPQTLFTLYPMNWELEKCQSPLHPSLQFILMNWKLTFPQHWSWCPESFSMSPIINILHSWAQRGLSGDRTF